MKVSRDSQIGIGVDHDLEKHNAECEKRKLGKRYYVDHDRPTSRMPISPDLLPVLTLYFQPGGDQGDVEEAAGMEKDRFTPLILCLAKATRGIQPAVDFLHLAQTMKLLIFQATASTLVNPADDYFRIGASMPVSILSLPVDSSRWDGCLCPQVQPLISGESSPCS